MAGLEGQTFAGYEVVSLLGRGGMGAVWKARQLMLNRFVALKIMAPDLAADAEFVKRFKREATAAANLAHENLVQVYSAGEFEGQHYIAMEFVEGETLRQKLDRQGRLDPQEAIAITVQVAQALQYAWNKTQLIHRDIKPENIFLTAKNEVRVGDMGLAKSVGGETTHLTATGITMGSPHYISPEQARGEYNLDFRSDIYSLGCTLFHLVTGRPPYEGADAMAIIGKHVHEPAPAIFKVWPTCPMPLALLVGRMVAKKRHERFGSYEELIAEMFRVSEKLKAATAPPAPASAVVETQVATRTPVPTVKPTTEAKQRLVIRDPRFVIGGAAVVLVIAVASLLWWSPWKSVPPSERITSREPRITSADAAFFRKVAALPAEQQVKRVVAKLKELNPGYDGQETHTIEDGQVTEFRITSAALKDLSPVRALAHLRRLCAIGSEGGSRCPMSDLSPLKGLSLIYLNIANSSVSDLSPLVGMPLESLCCGGTEVADLSLLRGMPLKRLDFWVTPVSDLSPLKGMRLTSLYCGLAAASVPRNREILRSIETLTKINGVPAAEFWRKLDAGELTKPGAPSAVPVTRHSSLVTPADAAFCAEVAALPAEQQVARVMAKLKELNPGFDPASAKHKVENGQVAELYIAAVGIVDVSPVRALAKLRTFACSATQDNRSSFGDLSPLKGLMLGEANFSYTQVADLSPLRGMPLKSLRATMCPISDVSPLAGAPLVCLMLAGASLPDLAVLRGFPLRELGINDNKIPIKDLSALRGMALEVFTFNAASVSDLSPLQGMPLTRLSCERTPVRDLSPLKGAPLRTLYFGSTQVTDLSPLAGMPLEKILCDAAVAGREENAKLLKSIRTLQSINEMPAAEFWRRLDAGELTKPGAPSAVPVTRHSSLVTPADAAFCREVAALPAEQQVARVVAKLRELNPEFDATPQIFHEDGKPTTLLLDSDKLTNISPLRALTWLRTLKLGRPTVPQGRIEDISPLRGLSLTSFESQYNPLTDLSPLAGMPLTNLWIMCGQARDWSVLRGMKLQRFGCSGGAAPDLALFQGMPLDELQVTTYHSISDLAPLRGLSLTKLGCWNTKISDLSPLRGMKLAWLHIGGASVRVRDLSPLAGMPLTYLNISHVPVDDLSPLKGMPLKEIVFRNAPGTDLSPLRSIRTLERINGLPAAVFWKQADAGKAPGAAPESPGLSALDPRLSAFCAEVAALPAEQQVARVVAELKELNPGFDGKEVHNIKGGFVVRLSISPVNVTDISPVRALAKLRKLYCAAGAAVGGSSALVDLRPLTGLLLTNLCLNATQVADLSPLRGMPLAHLSCQAAPVSDLSPLQGMPLTHLDVGYTRVADLSPVKGMPLEFLSCCGTEVSDLTPLQGMPLRSLQVHYTRVRDLSPLQGMPLRELKLDSGRATSARNLGILRRITTLETINEKPAAEFWKKMDAGKMLQAK